MFESDALIAFVKMTRDYTIMYIDSPFVWKMFLEMSAILY